MENRRLEKKSLSVVKPPTTEIEDEGIGKSRNVGNVSGMAAGWVIQATVTGCDDKRCRKSIEKLNFEKVKKDLTTKTFQQCHQAVVNPSTKHKLGPLDLLSFT